MDFARHSKQKKPVKFKSYVLFYQNVRGLRTKLDSCKKSILAEAADIFALCETFLISSVNDSELFPPGYTVVRRDRPGDCGWGGVLLAARDEYNLQQIVDVDGYENDIELVIALIALKYKKNMLCCLHSTKFK